jgi:hypothetical protein
VKKTSALLIILGFLLFEAAATATTFIGNGGNIMDSEVKSTLKRIKAAAQRAKSAADLCECPWRSEQCLQLSELSEEKRVFCKEVGAAVAPEMLKILEDIDSVRFVFSSDRLRLQHDESMRDAVVQSKDQTIYIDENRFAKMSKAQRVQLLTHELLHLIKWQGTLFTDEAGYGPFSGGQGGRDLLDTIGLAYAQEAIKARVAPVDRRIFSRPFYRWRLNFENGSASIRSSAAQASFLDGSRYSYSFLSLSYFPRVTDNLGYVLKSHSMTAEGSRHGVEGTLLATFTHAGAVYRFLPWESSTGFFDSFLVSLYGGAGYGSIRHEIKDEFNHLAAKKATYGLFAAASLDVPLLFNLWFSCSYAASYAPYEMKELDISSKNILTTTTYGVSYAF